MVEQLDRVTRAIVRALANGQELTLLVPDLRCSRSTLQMHKKRLARLIRDCLGADILRQVQELPYYRNAVIASREKAGMSLGATGCLRATRRGGKESAFLFWVSAIDERENAFTHSAIISLQRPFTAME